MKSTTGSVTSPLLFNLRPNSLALPPVKYLSTFSPKLSLNDFKRDAFLYTFLPNLVLFDIWSIFLPKKPNNVGVTEAVAECNASRPNGSSSTMALIPCSTIGSNKSIKSFTLPMADFVAPIKLLVKLVMKSPLPKIDL